MKQAGMECQVVAKPGTLAVLLRAVVLGEATVGEAARSIGVHRRTFAKFSSGTTSLHPVRGRAWWAVRPEDGEVMRKNLREATLGLQCVPLGGYNVAKAVYPDGIPVRFLRLALEHLLCGFHEPFPGIPSRLAGRAGRELRRSIIDALHEHLGISRSEVRKVHHPSGAIPLALAAIERWERSEQASWLTRRHFPDVTVYQWAKAEAAGLPVASVAGKAHWYRLGDLEAFGVVPRGGWEDPRL